MIFNEEQDYEIANDLIWRFEVDGYRNVVLGYTRYGYREKMNKNSVETTTMLLKKSSDCIFAERRVLIVNNIICFTISI